MKKRKVLISIICLALTTLSAFPSSKVLDENNSRINYTLSCLGFPFKKKFLPVTVEISLKEEENSKCITLNKIDLKAEFTSKDNLFRRVIDLDTYPSFTFKSNLEKPEILSNRDDFEIGGYINFHGIDKEVKVKFKNKSKDNLIYLVGTLNIKMTDFGIKPPRILLLSVDNIIKTKIELYTKMVK